MREVIEHYCNIEDYKEVNANKWNNHYSNEEIEDQWKKYLNELWLNGYIIEGDDEITFDQFSNLVVENSCNLD
jgi:hypothetical protein